MDSKVDDWDDAYANGAYIEAADTYPGKWARAALHYRRAMVKQQLADIDISYGTSERQKLDIFRPEKNGQGLLVFVHGGYWRAFDKSCWSHLARGAIRQGWTVALPSYDLAPAVSISEITRQVGTAINMAAVALGGPIRLAGHSAGGHLVSRMICRDSPLAPEVRARIQRVVSISGLHDLRPLLKTKMNADFNMDETEATAESPALNHPIDSAELVCWVGFAGSVRKNARNLFARQSYWRISGPVSGLGLRFTRQRRNTISTLSKVLPIRNRP